MQKLQILKRQRGSVLVGVIGLSMAMSVAAGGFILLSANTAEMETDLEIGLQLRYAAESGIEMGIRWINLHPEAPTTTWPTYLELTPGGFITMDAIKVKVVFEKPAGAGPSEYQLLSLAKTDDPNQDQVSIKRKINFIGTPASGVHYSIKSKPNLGPWTETVITAP